MVRKNLSGLELKLIKLEFIIYLPKLKVLQFLTNIGLMKWIWAYNVMSVRIWTYNSCQYSQPPGHIWLIFLNILLNSLFLLIFYSIGGNESPQTPQLQTRTDNIFFYYVVWWYTFGSHLGQSKGFALIFPRVHNCSYPLYPTQQSRSTPSFFGCSTTDCCVVLVPRGDIRGPYGTSNVSTRLSSRGV